MTRSKRGMADREGEKKDEKSKEKRDEKPKEAEKTDKGENSDKSDQASNRKPMSGTLYAAMSHTANLPSREMTTPSTSTQAPLIISSLQRTISVLTADSRSP
jgi:hypothetical protein